MVARIHMVFVQSVLQPESSGWKTLQTAFNIINALHLIGGITTASLLKLKPEHSKMLLDLSETELNNFVHHLTREDG